MKQSVIQGGGLKGWGLDQISGSGVTILAYSSAPETEAAGSHKTISEDSLIFVVTAMRTSSLHNNVSEHRTGKTIQIE
jgi:hypothetical protein